MAVHTNSVISTTISDFDYDLYVAITDKEEYCYDSGVNGQETEFSPHFTTLSAAIVAWMQSDREARMGTFIQSLYSYKVMSDLYSTSSTLLASADGAALVDMNGYRTRIKADATAYYDDYPTVTVTTTTITRSVGSWLTDGFDSAGGDVTVTGGSAAGTYTVSNVTASTITIITGGSGTGESNVIITQVNGARMGGSLLITDTATIGASFAIEETEMDALIAGFVATVSSKVMSLLFSDEQPGATLNKVQMNEYIFDTLGYRSILGNLNVGELVAPPMVADRKIAVESN